MNSHQRYFFTQFPHEALDYLKKHPAPPVADHPNQLMHQGAVILDDADDQGPILENYPNKFCFSWYAIAFLDWGLRSHFPEDFQEWIGISGGSPFPVVIQDGEATATLPYQILADREEVAPKWREFCSFYLEGIVQYLGRLKNVTPKQFFETLAKSETWDFQNDLFADILFHEAVKAFEIEGVFE